LHHRLGSRFALALTLALFALPPIANAYTAAPGYTARDYATGLPSLSCCHWGPIGVAFDQSDNLYVADSADGNLYRFQPGGGSAADARVSQSPIPGTPKGLAVTPDGRLYLAREHAGDVVELDPATGKVLRTVASGLRCATGLAADPVSGDLFVTQNRCGSVVWRISGFAGGPGKEAWYAVLRNYCCLDGLAFDADGTLYAEGAGHVLQIAGTSSSTPGAAREIAYAPNADGMAFGAHARGHGLPFLAVNRNDGIVTRIDVTRTPPSSTNILTGGTRGDFAAVDSHGCLYVTQSSSIVRMTGPNGSCPFSPSTAGRVPLPGLILEQLAPSPSATSKLVCTRLRRIVLRLRQRGRVRLRSAVVYVNGRRVKTVRGGRVTRAITLTRLPRASFTVKIVGRTTRGRKLAATHSYRNCQPPPRCVSRVKLSVRQHGGRVVEVDAYIGRRRVKLLRGHRITSLTLSHVPKGRFMLRVVSRTASGRRNVTFHSYVGCTPRKVVRHHTPRR
jgi:hypothetical protein